MKRLHGEYRLSDSDASREVARTFIAANYVVRPGDVHLTHEAVRITSADPVIPAALCPRFVMGFHFDAEAADETGYIDVCPVARA